MNKSLPQKDHEFLSLDEVASYLKIPKSTIYKLSQKGGLPSCKIGKQLRFRKGSIDAWVAGKEGGTTAAADSLPVLEDARPRANLQPRNVLLIDDDSLVLRTIARFLSHQGYTVVTAPNAQEAFALVEQRGFDLVITDIKMPGIDGIETVRRIRQINTRYNRPPAQEVMITGYLDTFAESEAQKLGITDYVYKPFAIAEFLKMVKDKLHIDAN